MIKELEGEMTVELLNKYFFNHKQTKNERKKCKDLYNMFKYFTKKVYGENEDIFSYNEWFGYLDEYGYYILVDGDPGKCLPYLENYGIDKDIAFYQIISRFLDLNSHYYEFNNRSELEKDFVNRFGEFDFKPLYGLERNRYFGCNYFAEYAMDKWDKYYDGSVPEKIIEDYEKYLNDIWWSKEQGVMWNYDINNKKFNCQRNQKIKKLTK